MIWERITRHEYRAKVLGGWIVKVYGDSGFQPNPMAICFVPDSNHEWVIERSE